MHLDGGLIVLQQFQFIVQLFLALLLNRLEAIFVKMTGSSEPVELTFFLVLFNLSTVHDDKPELILGVELSKDLELIGGSVDVAYNFTEHRLNWIGWIVLSLSLEGQEGNLFLPLRS